MCAGGLAPWARCFWPASPAYPLSLLEQRQKMSLCLPRDVPAVAWSLLDELLAFHSDQIQVVRFYNPLGGIVAHKRVVVVGQCLRNWHADAWQLNATNVGKNKVSFLLAFLSQGAASSIKSARCFPNGESRWRREGRVHVYAQRKRRMGRDVC